MFVSRIVHPQTGVGPYISQGDVCNTHDPHDSFWLDKVMDSMKGTPEPNKDNELVENYRIRYPKSFYVHADGHLFGFTDLLQAFKWFGSCAIEKMIHWYGFELITKEVPDDQAVRGGSQCMVTEDAWNNAKITKYWTAQDVHDFASARRRKR